MKNVSTVLFDFDGTVADTGRGITDCALLALQAFGYDEPKHERLREFVGPPLVDSFIKYCGDEETARKMVDEYRVHYSAGGMLKCELYDGAEEMLKRLFEAGKKIAVASSKPEPFIRELLVHLGVDKYFSYISAPQIGHINPSKHQLILRAMEAVGAQSETTVMVGDRLFDIEGAKQSSVRSIGAAYGYGGEAELKEYGADYICSCPLQITELILE